MAPDGGKLGAGRFRVARHCALARLLAAPSRLQQMTKRRMPSAGQQIRIKRAALSHRPWPPYAANAAAVARTARRARAGRNHCLHMPWLADSARRQSAQARRVRSIRRAYQRLLMSPAPMVNQQCPALRCWPFAGERPRMPFETLVPRLAPSSSADPDGNTSAPNSVQAEADGEQNRICMHPAALSRGNTPHPSGFRGC